MQRGQFTAHNGRIQILYPNWHICQDPVSNFNRNPIAVVISGSGIQFLLKNFVNPTSFKKGSERRNLPKDGEFKTQPVEKKYEVNKYSKINKFQPPPSHSPSHFENTLLVRNIEIQIEQIASRIYQNSVLNFNFPLAHVMGCIENQISIVTIPI